MALRAILTVEGVPTIEVWETTVAGHSGDLGSALRELLLVGGGGHQTPLGSTGQAYPGLGDASWRRSPCRWRTPCWTPTTWCTSRR